MTALATALKEYWWLLVLIPAAFLLAQRYRSRKVHKRLQKVLLITEDMRLVVVSLLVELGYIVNHKWAQAWLMDPGILIRRRGTNLSYLFLDERDAAPQAITPQAEARRAEFTEEKPAEKDGGGADSEFSRIGRERGMEAINKSTTSQEQSEQHELLKTAFLAIAVIFGFVMLATLAINKFKGGA